jgi:hypothetical protein
MIRRFFLLIITPIFLYSSQLDVLNLANKLQLYEKNEWKALLHYNRNLNIIDNKFILSKVFSLENELNATIVGFYAPAENYQDINNHPQCKFPARLLFITHELNVSKQEFPEINCPDLTTYKMKAPADKIFLTYASENVKNPSSMMGHTFLKYSGKNYQGRVVNHAITFYTLLDTLNLAILAYQNVFSGMNGQFALQPYQKTLEQYTDKENRNVWEFQLRLSEYRNKLIYYHMFELKNINMKYYFTSYNCSTIIYYALSLANPQIYDEKKLWITPLDTVKFLYKYNLIINSEIHPSDEWLIKMLQENITSNEIDNIKDIVQYKQYDQLSKLDFLSLNLLEAYIDLKYKQEELSVIEFTTFKNNIDKLQKSYKNIIDISKYKSPNKIPDERQLSAGYSNTNDKKYLELSFLPASHLLNDYNREYFGESELKIAYLSVLLNKDSINLKDFTLYGMKTYIPYDTLTKDLSYQFEVAIKKEYSRDMSYVNTVKIDGGVGIDFLLGHDINSYAIVNAGMGYNKHDNVHLFFNPEIGVMIYEVLNMKSLIYYQPLFINNNKYCDKYVLNHNIFFSNYKIYFNFEEVISEKKYHDFEFGLSKIF